MRRYTARYNIYSPWHIMKFEWGVEFVYDANEHNCYIDSEVQIGKGTKIWPGITLDGNVKIGKNCEIGKNATIRGSIRLEDGVFIDHDVQILGEGYIGEQSIIKHDLTNPRIGKYCTVMGQVHDSIIVGRCCIGEKAEINRTFLGYGVNAKHDCGVRDVDIGPYTNIAEGVRIWNNDGANKRKTKVGGMCFLGGNVRILGGVEIGDECYISESSLVDRNLPSRAFFVNSTPGARQATAKENCSWYLGGNYLYLKNQILPIARANFLKKIWQKLAWSPHNNEFKKWLASPLSSHNLSLSPTELLKQKGASIIPCLLDECECKKS